MGKRKTKRKTTVSNSTAKKAAEKVVEPKQESFQELADQCVDRPEFDPEHTHTDNERIKELELLVKSGEDKIKKQIQLTDTTIKGLCIDIERLKSEGDVKTMNDVKGKLVVLAQKAQDLYNKDRAKYPRLQIIHRELVRLAAKC